MAMKAMRWTRALAGICATMGICGAPIAQQLGKLVASDAAPASHFGFAVAMSGDTLVVGARARNSLTGAVYVFRKGPTAWTEEAIITALDGSRPDSFGSSVALEGDTLVVGAPGDRVVGIGSGSAYVFARSGATWTQQAKLVPSDAAPGDGFGSRVAVDGDTAVIATHAASVAGLAFAGAAWVFERSGTTWAQQTKLTAQDAAANDWFGVSLSMDGGTVVIGAYYADQPGGVDAGAAYVFTGGGTLWTQEAKLVASDAAAGDNFGSDVSASGGVVLVGAWSDDLASGSNAGSAYVFVRGGATWTEQAKLTASDGAMNDYLGLSVSLAGDAAIVGASMNDHGGFVNPGAAYVFRQRGGVWTEESKLVADAPQTESWFGFALAGSGHLFAVGAWQDDNAGGVAAGSVYLFASGLSEPHDVVVFDADGDGDQDAATANRGTGDLSLFANDGALALAARIALDPADRGPEAVAAGDLDGDGAADDLAVACADSDSVVLVTNAGDVTPMVTSLAAGGFRPVDVAVLDLDADPRGDVVVALEGSPFGAGDGIAVSRNGGAFVPVPIPGGYPQRAVRLATGDLDGDGDADLAVLAQGGIDQILLFLGAGDGTLTLAGGIALPTSSLSRGLGCGDLDGDGDLDLAVVLPALFPTPSTLLRVYTFAPNGALDPADYAASGDLATVGTFGSDVAIGDFDHDGSGDLAIVHSGSGQLEILQGWNGASFASTSTPSAGSAPIAVAAGEIDGGGGDDLLVASQDSNDVTVLILRPAAIAAPYGAGCAGTAGLVPGLSGIGLPVQPSATFGVRLVDARAFAPALLLFGGLADSAPLTGGCTVLVMLPAASTVHFTNAAGTASFVFGVPAAPPLEGLELFFQYAVFDPVGSFHAALAFSNGLRVQVGN